MLYVMPITNKTFVRLLLYACDPLMIREIM